MSLVNHNLHGFLTYPGKNYGARRCGKRDSAACGGDDAEEGAVERVERHLLAVAKTGDGDVACSSSDGEITHRYAVDARGVKSLDCPESTPWISRLVCVDCSCRDVERGVGDGCVIKHTGLSTWYYFWKTIYIFQFFAATECTTSDICHRIPYCNRGKA